MVLPPILLLIAISAIGPIVLNGVLPANTAIMAELQTDYGTAQLVLTVFLLAILFGQIFLGNAADQYGRRPVMLISLFGFAIGGALCAVAPSIEWLLAARFIQGFFASVCSFLPRTMVRDVYAREKSASVIGYMTVAMMVAPMFGPAMGGFITDNLSWRWMYAGLSFIGGVLFVVCWFLLHETRSEETAANKKIPLRVAAKDLLKIRAFVATAIMLSGSVGIYYAFLAGSPYLMMESRGFSASQFGTWFAIVPVGYLSGNFIAGRYSQKFGVSKMITFGAIPGMLGIALLWILSFSTHPLSLFIPMQLVAFSNGMSLPNLLSAAMSVRTDLISSSSGLAGAFQTAFGVVLTLTLGMLLPLGDYWLFIMVTLSALLWAYGIWVWSTSTDHH